MMHRRFTDRRVALLGIAAALALGCEKLLGIHDLDGGTGASGSDDSRLPFSGSDSGSSYSGFSSGASSGIPGGVGSGTISGAGESSGGSSSGSTSGSSSGTTGAIMLTGLACTISSATHWTAGVYLADCNIQVDGALTIDPGAIIKFTAGHSMSVSGSGAITALGSDTMPIVFTSIKDDTHGGNTGGNTPAVGDWNGITLDASGSTLDHCGFYYAGASDTPALVIKSQATVTNSIFAHNRGPTDSPYAAPALDASDAAAQTAIKSNTFYDNRVPLRIGRNVSLDDSNSFDNGVAAPMNRQPNEFNGIEFASLSYCNANTDIVNSITWFATKVPFIIGNPSSTWLCVDGQLTLGPNVILKFFPGGKLEVAQSGATGTQTTSSGDIFTSIKDDANGGDTNGDMAATTPMAGDWLGVVENSVCETWPNILFSTVGCQ